jgi:hypothetical protein
MIDAVVIQPGSDVDAPSAAGMSWASVTAGAVVSCAHTFVLLAFGIGLGLSVVSPWAGSGVSATTFKIGTGLYLIVIAMLSSSIGGYLAGRLRTGWVGVHSDEVYFRDTAHGFLAWAVAAVIMAAALSSAASSAVGNVVRAAGTVAGAAAEGAGASAAQSGGVDPMGYLVDTLFRSDHPDANAEPQETRAEATRIILSGLRDGDMGASDKTYLAQLVSARTGISQADAEKRVNEVIAKAKDAETKARQAADTARKTAAAIAFFTAFSMLIGAFIAAVAATIAGHRRDEVLAFR